MGASWQGCQPARTIDTAKSGSQPDVRAALVLMLTAVQLSAQPRTSLADIAPRCIQQSLLFHDVKEGGRGLKPARAVEHFTCLKVTEGSCEGAAHVVHVDTQRTLSHVITGQ